MVSPPDALFSVDGFDCKRPILRSNFVSVIAIEESVGGLGLFG
jgi:hypothetical protein